MPFTFCHPAIVLPLKKIKYFSLTALIIGSMMPDFEYFIRMKLRGEHGHTLWGIFYFCIPLGFILTFVYHNIVRNPLINNLPVFLQKKFLNFTAFNWNQYCNKHILTVILSLFIGTFSHLFWDAFTHYDGFFVTRIPILSSEINIYKYQIYIYSFLQYFSTVIGALIILWVILQLPKQVLKTYPVNINYWIYSILLMVTISIIRFIIRFDDFSFGNLIVTIIGTGLFSLILVSCFRKKLPGNWS